MKATTVEHTDSSKYGGKTGYILHILHEIVEEVTTFENQIINVSLQNSINVFLRI